MTLGIVFSLLSAISFSTSAILAKLGYAQGLTVSQVLQLRFTLAVPLILLLILLRDRALPRVSLSLILKGLLLGGILYGIQSSCYYNALVHIPASTASLVLYLYPVTVALLARLFFGQRIGRKGFLALVTVVAGCALVFFDAFQRRLEPLGLALAFGAMATYSFYFVALQAAVKNERPMILTFFVIVFAAVSFNILGDPSYLLRISRPGWIYGGSLALFSTVMGLAFLYLAVERLGSAHAAVIFTVEPISVVTLSWLVLHEKIAAWQVAGMVLIVSGIVIKNLVVARKAGPAHPNPA